MTIEIVEERLDALLKSERAKVLLLTGGWGAGKTHQWKQALQRAAAVGNQPRYAYISLFGLTSLAEVRKRVAEETVSAIKLPGKTGTVGEAIEEGGWQLKPLQIMKLLPVIPYLGKLEGLANELSFASVRNAVVCFDDLERGGKGLHLTDVFGLASFLKEERNCKVVLISNEEKLNSESKDELSRYLEKVVDENIHFAPTSTEACKIALGDTPDLARALLLEKVEKLNISNIRVISRLSNMAEELAVIFEGLHELVLKEAINTLALFGAAHFLPTDGFPTVDYLMKISEDNWSRYFRDAKNTKEETDEERLLAKWEARLTSYGYTHTSHFDEEIGRSVKRGFFDRSTLIPLARQLSDSSAEQVLIAKYHDAWTKFWHSLEGDGEQMLCELAEISFGAIKVIGPDDLQNAFDVFSQAGKDETAMKLLEQFIASNQHRPKIFGAINGAFHENYSGAVAEHLQAEFEKHKATTTIEEALDRINFDQGWNPEDIRIVSKADRNEIEKLLHVAEPRRFQVRLKTLLRIGTLQDAQENDKRLSELTLEFLKELASKDSIIAIRMRRFIPNNEVEKPKKQQRPPVK